MCTHTHILKEHLVNYRVKLSQELAITHSYPRVLMADSLRIYSDKNNNFTHGLYVFDWGITWCLIGRWGSGIKDSVSLCLNLRGYLCSGTSGEDCWGNCWVCMVFSCVPTLPGYHHHPWDPNNKHSNSWGSQNLPSHIQTLKWNFVSREPSLWKIRKCCTASWNHDIFCELTVSHTQTKKNITLPG